MTLRALTHASASPLPAPRSHVTYTGKGAINIARWAVRIVNVNAIATFFRAAESGTVAAAAGGSCSLLSPPLLRVSSAPLVRAHIRLHWHTTAAEEVVAQAEEAEKILQGA